MAVDDPTNTRDEASPNWRWMPFGLVSCVVVLLGFVADFFGPMDLGDLFPSDAVAYLDCARAFARGDFATALNPLWSQGYPVLLALVRPAFTSLPQGTWYAAHTLNLVIYVASWLAFCWLVSELLSIGKSTAVLVATASAFLTAQVCVDQVSRIGPDKLVALFLYLACALVLRLARKPAIADASALGLLLGLGFLAKAPFLPIGCVTLLALALNLRRRSIRPISAPAAIFVLIVLGYGAALSRATAWPTLGESGSINYAWHVNRLEKWVHWQGGTLDAQQAWDSPRLAAFARWTADPPDFGRPDHPTQASGDGPTLYLFHSSRNVTYDPYYDPPYWYRGYHSVFRWRYQLIALAKSVWHLVHAVVLQPLFWALALVALWARKSREATSVTIFVPWPVTVTALAAICIYLPVHLEDRYIGAPLAVLAVILIASWPRSFLNKRVVPFLLAGACLLGIAINQRDGWSNFLHGTTYKDNPKWKLGVAARSVGLPAGSPIAVISFGPSYDCDWAFVAELKIIGEIATEKDEAAYLKLTPTAQSEVLAKFREAGATAVFTRDQAVGALSGWFKAGTAPIWVYRLN